MIDEILKKLIEYVEDTEEFGAVYEYEAANLEGMPACVILPSGNESSYNTTSDNERIYAFQATIYLDRNKAIPSRKDDSQKWCDEVMRGLVDKVMDKFDKNWRMSGIVCPTGYALMNMFSTPSAWGYSGKDAEFRVAQINIKVRVIIDLDALA